MPTFVVNRNAQSNGDHEVHNSTSGCSYMPSAANQVDLGYHTDCFGAVAYAKNRWQQARINGCFYCCRPCHTS